MFGLQFSGLPLQTLAIAGGVCALIITILYLLKLRKRRVQVPFSPLWGRVLTEYKQQSDWWRRFRRILSWLLQILLAAALLFALADPHPENEVVQGRHILLLIDSSASMGATDVSGAINRLDLAKKKAEDIIKTAGAEDRVMLVNFNNQLQPLSPFVTEVALLDKPLRNIQVTATSTNFEQAMSFAVDSLKDVKRGELVLLSDGAGLDPERIKALNFAKTTTVRHIKLGESAGNIAVTAFSVRRYLANKLDYELFVRVENFFDRRIKADLQIWADGRMVDTKPIELDPKGSIQRFFPAQAVSGERLEARVRVTTADARDVLPLDDKAYALLPKIQKSKVLVVTDGNLYLEGTLLLNENIETERVAPDAYTPEKTSGFDVVFFDRFVPKDLPERGNFVLIDPTGENSPWESAGFLAKPIITSHKKSHPLMRWIGMRDINIGVGSKLRRKAGDTVVASSFGNPMILTRDNKKQRFITLAFDIRNSDLPLRVAFPVLIINMIDYFQLDEGSLVQNYGTGQTWSISVDKEQGSGTVRTPKGKDIKVPIYNGQAIVYGDQAGFYELTLEDSSKQLIAANLSTPEESKIAPTDLQIADKVVSNDTKSLFFDRKELWIWALLIVLGMLLLEWWTYNRRVTV